MIRRLTFATRSQGLVEITDQVLSVVRGAAVKEGLCTVFVQHTSASLIISENADPTAKQDLERWINKLVAEDDRSFSHTSEGPDDMPSHIKSVLTNPSLNIPIADGTLALGAWQGIYLWEHRHGSHRRSVVVYVGP